ncbi:MAG: YqaE/Pmp3 family membrane protein [Synechococcales cyanobacterium RU_4_20]|nr:YqaE/Pmp3 family membrane protein [Synechococcales cyanobacterium RU_4_20]NJR69202.1 YqaE/Pmp3 family membrane protein [Synechococcales cyanobacterium CRU_2_2]
MNKLLRYAIAIALPPVGVFLTYGISTALFINVPLTILGWLPGSIHAVWAIAKHNEKAENEKQMLKQQNTTEVNA